MKKTIALVLCLLVVGSLAACGGQASGIDESTASTEQIETTTPEAETAETQNVETQISEETETESAQTENVVWTLDEIPRPSDSAGNPNGENEVEYGFQNMTKEDAEERLNNYEELLANEGFVIEVTKNESDKRISIAKSGNAKVEIYFDKAKSAIPDDKYVYGMGVYITVEPVNVNADLSLDEFVSLIPALPDVKWSDDEFENGSTRWKHYNTSHLNMDTITEYVNSLKESGYTVDVEEAPEGNEDYDVYYFSAFDQDGVEVRVKVTAPADGVLATTISVGVKK